jgi:hypothetical protein
MSKRIFGVLTEKENKMDNFAFDIVDAKKDENGNYVALIDRYGNEISFKTNDGKRIPFNKEAVENFLRRQEEARQ